MGAHAGAFGASPRGSEGKAGALVERPAFRWESASHTAWVSGVWDNSSGCDVFFYAAGSPCLRYWKEVDEWGSHPQENPLVPSDFSESNPNPAKVA